MAFSLSFSPEFFYAPGEPYDAELPEGYKEKPTSVYQALCALRVNDPEEYQAMADDLLGANGCHVDPEHFMDLITETDTCDSLSSPVGVYVDPEGHYMVEVWDI